MNRGRHIDQNARMVWLSLRSQKRAMTVAELVAFWRPTFSAMEIEDALVRLFACNHINAHGLHVRQYVIEHSSVPLPGVAVACLADKPRGDLARANG